MSAIVGRVKAVAAIDKSIAKHQEEVRRFTDRSSESARRHAEAVAAWKQRARDALAAGQDFNEPPPTEPLSPEARRLRLDDLKSESDTLHAAWLRAVDEAGPEIEEVARREVAKAMGKVVKLIGPLRAALADVRAAQTAFLDVEGARRMLDPKQSRPHHTPQLFGLFDLLQAALDGSDPLDRFERPTARVLGLQPGHTLHQPVEPQAEPTLQRSGPASGLTVTVRGFDGRPLP